jgi:hypothetical protein
VPPTPRSANCDVLYRAHVVMFNRHANFVHWCSMPAVLFVFMLRMRLSAPWLPQVRVIHLETVADPVPSYAVSESSTLSPSQLDAGSLSCTHAMCVRVQFWP